MSAFSGLYISVSGMKAHQAAIETTGHNISNVSNKEYTRQEAVFLSRDSQPSILFKGIIGGGVTMEGPRRMADEYLEKRISYEYANAEAWKVRSELIQQVESNINTLNLPEKFNAFWDAWHGLSLDPNLEFTRFEVQQQAGFLVDVLKTAQSQLLAVEDQINQTMVEKIQEIKILAEQIGQLNGEIRNNIIKGMEPNDLLDRRAVLLKELVGITGAAVEYSPDHTVSVTLEELKLVDGVEVQEIPPGTEVITTGGILFGLKEIRDGDLQTFLTSLNDIARSLAAEVNALHVTGYSADGSTGVNFFQGSVFGAADLDLSEEIKGDPAKIGANGSGPEDTGKIALEISNLGEDFSRKMAEFMGRIGTASKNTMMQDNCHQEILLTMDNMRAELSGVSMDEELANMIRFQRAYQASARVFSAMDEILETLINIIR